jgi:DNA-binding XRE family transcriptional regulator
VLGIDFWVLAMYLCDIIWRVNKLSMGKSVALCKLLKKKRKERGFTQTVMAKKMGISLRGYQRFEAGATMERYQSAMDILDLTVVVVDKTEI